MLYPGLLTDTPGNSVADRSSYTLSLTDIPVDLYTQSVYSRLLTDTSGLNAAGRYSYTLLLPDIQVYTSRDRPLYPGRLTDIPGNSVADTDLRIQCTLSLTYILVYIPGERLLYPRY